MLRRLLVVIAVLVAVAQAPGVEAGAFADANCGAAPATGGAPTQVRLERAATSAGPFTPLPIVAYPVPAPGLVTDALPASMTSVVYRCAYGNAAGFGAAGPVSDPMIVVQVPGSPVDKPTIIIRFQ